MVLFECFLPSVRSFGVIESQGNTFVDTVDGRCYHLGSRFFCLEIVLLGQFDLLQLFVDVVKFFRNCHENFFHFLQLFFLGLRCPLCCHS